MKRKPVIYDRKAQLLWRGAYLAIVLVLAGCAGLPKLSDAEVSVAQTRNQPGDQHHKAIGAAIRALADFRKVSFAETAAAAAQDYAAARSHLSRALAKLQSKDGFSCPQGMESIVQALENCRTAMNEIIDADQRSDQTGLAAGWQHFDAAVLGLAEELRPKGFIGINVQDSPLSEEANEGVINGRVRIADVLNGGPAAVAGVQKNDLLTRWNDLYIPDCEWLEEQVDLSVPGESVQIEAIRAGQVIHFTVLVGEQKRAF